MKTIKDLKKKLQYGFGFKIIHNGNNMMILKQASSNGNIKNILRAVNNKNISKSYQMKSI